MPSLLPPYATSKLPKTACSASAKQAKQFWPSERITQIITIPLVRSSCSNQVATRRPSDIDVILSCILSSSSAISINANPLFELNSIAILDCQTETSACIFFTSTYIVGSSTHVVCSNWPVLQVSFEATAHLCPAHPLRKTE